MKNSWKDRTNLKMKVVESRKQHFLNRLLNEQISIEESEEIVERVVHCNKILFELKMSQNCENPTKTE